MPRSLSLTGTVTNPPTKAPAAAAKDRSGALWFRGVVSVVDRPTDRPTTTTATATTATTLLVERTSYRHSASLVCPQRRRNDTHTHTPTPHAAGTILLLCCGRLVPGRSSLFWFAVCRNLWLGMLASATLFGKTILGPTTSKGTCGGTDCSDLPGRVAP